MTAGSIKEFMKKLVSENQKMIVEDLVVDQKGVEEGSWSSVYQDRIFQSEYEKKINELKMLFQVAQFERLNCSGDIEGIKKDFDVKLDKLRRFVRSFSERLNTKMCSSVFAIPTAKLDSDEMLIHRIWLGGALQRKSRCAIKQWEEALKRIPGHSYNNILWVWDKEQFLNDKSFVSTGGDGLTTIGSYKLDGVDLHVNSLKILTKNYVKENQDILFRLNENGYYSSLSDYFRILILIRYGGIYMDCDTIPYKLAAQFLANPEIPSYQVSGKEEKVFVNWMNLFLDETGFVVTKKENENLSKLFEEVNENYRELPSVFHGYSKKMEVLIFDKFYSAWKKHFNCTFIDHGGMMSNYGVFFDGKKEKVVAGVEGMRLVLDIISNITLPLTSGEKISYKKCISNMNRISWKLENPSDFPKYVDMLYLEEYPRMAYAPQLRSDKDHYHFYNVLSEDENLDKVNQIFEEYLIDLNMVALGKQGYWKDCGNLLVVDEGESCGDCERGSRLVAYPELNFVEGKFISDRDKNKMANLLFQTSYLEYCSVKNTLGLGMVELQRKQNIDPYTNFLHGIYDQARYLSGFVISGSCEQFEMLKVDSYYREEIRELDRRYDEFLLQHFSRSTYFAASTVIVEKCRGNAIKIQIFEKMKSLAKREGCNRLILTVYEKNRALKLYQKLGFRIIDTFDYSYEFFFDRVKLLELEL